MQQRAHSPKIVNSWIIAAVLCINTFSKILGIFIAIPYNIVMMEAVMMFFIAWANKKVLLLIKELIVILLIVAAIMGYSFLLWGLDGRVTERLLKFVMYALFSMMCIQYPFEEAALLKAVFTFGFIHAAYLFAYATPLINSGVMSLDNTMDLSYTSLIYLFADAWVVRDKSQKKMLRLMAFTLCLAFTYFLAVVSTNRGALISAICYFALYPVVRCTRRSLRVTMFLLIIAAAVLVYLNLVPILEAIDEYTSSHGVIINPLRKSIWQMNNTDSMTSGREDNYAAAIEMIRETLALPNGVASYHIYTNVAYYPHNIFLEAGVEFGFIGFVLVAIIILRACNIMVFKQTKYSHMILMFFCLSITRLMFSSSYWENTFIWPMMLLMWPSVAEGEALLHV